MEMTCTRCHQAVPEDSCYCPACGLPQLVYSGENGTVPPSSERWPEQVRDASSIDWKPGMRVVLGLAVPAGLLCSAISPLNALGVFWMAGAAAWAVVLYMRTQRPAWITAGAGARIGLVTGLIAAWLAFGVSGAGSFVERVALHQGPQVDAEWKDFVNADVQKAQQMISQMGSGNVDAVQENVKMQRNLMLSPEGHAGFAATYLAIGNLFLILFAVAGGALGARMLARSKRPQT